MTEQNIDTEGAVLAAAATIYYNDELDDATKEDELDALTSTANDNGIQLTAADIVEQLEDRADVDDTPVSYSWVHINEFRLFELHDQCFPWATPEDLRDAVDEVP